MFRVGQKVVCIHHHPIHLRKSWGNYPEKDGIYTVRGMNPYKNTMLLLLCELVNGIHESGIEYGFDSTRFRPIVERKTDISIFTEISRRESAPSPLAEAGA